MDDKRLGTLLRAHPRAKASPQFTSEVLRAARKSRADAAPRPRLVLRFAAALAIVLFAFAAQLAYKERRLDALRAEHLRLEAELEAVKQAAGDTAPVVVFEQDDGSRVIVDVAPQQDVQTVAYTTFD